MDELASGQYPVREDMAFQRRMWVDLHGLERMAQIKFAILEPTGKIRIVPRSQRANAFAALNEVLDKQRKLSRPRLGGTAATTRSYSLLLRGAARCDDLV